MIVLKCCCFMLVLMSMLAPLAGATGQGFFNLAPQDPLYAPYRADTFAPTASLQYLTLIPGSARPSYTYLTEHDDDGRVIGLKGYNFDTTYGDRDEHEYIFMRAGASIPFARINLGDLLRVEGFLYGGMRTVFLAFAGTDQLGFDGTYAYGAQARLGDFLSLQAGRKHFSGHTGDEILTRVVDFASSDEALDYNAGPLESGDFQSNLVDYVHQDPQFIALSFEPGERFRLYGEMRYGRTARIWKPDPSCEEEHPDFLARELQVGSELTLDGFFLGDFQLSIDMTFHEMGKFALVPDESLPVYQGQYARYTYEYDEHRPWDMDLSITLAKQLSRRDRGPDVFLQGSFYSGRFPMLAFYMHEVNYFSIGATITY